MRKDVSRRAYRVANPPAPRGEDQHTLGIYRTATMALIVIAIICATGLELFARLRIEPDGFAVLTWIVAAFLVVSRMFRPADAHYRLADLLGTLGVVWIAGVACGSIAMLGLRLHLPTADELLFYADRSVGADALALVGWTTREQRWLGPILIPAYAYTIPLLTFSMSGLALAGKRVEAWRAAFCFTGSLLTVCLLAIAAPARGLGIWVPDELLGQLPSFAMRYALASFDAFYDGADPVLRLKAINGVICFPSFHAAMGFITTAMWRKTWLTLALAGAWFAAMLIATIPYGGHYVVDVLGGLVVGGGWFWLSRRLENQPVAPTKPRASEEAVIAA